MLGVVLTLTIYGALGAVFGSFLACACYRVPRGMSLLKPAHSFCPHCRHPLQAADLVPLLSYLWLKARCRWCGAKIAPQYFMIELITTLAVVTLGWFYGPHLTDLAQWAYQQAL